MFFILPEIFQMQKNIRSSRHDLDRRRLKQLKKQVTNAYNNVPFYRNTLTALKITPEDFTDINDIRKLPIISKATVNANFNFFLNEKIHLDTCYMSHTSGSTGQPFSTYFDRRSWLRKKFIAKLRARFACGMRRGERMAIFETEPSQKIEIMNKKNSLRDILLKVKYFSIFDDMDMVLKQLMAFKAQNAYGPQSYFFHLARTAEKTNQSLPFLKRIFTSSEYRENTVAEYIKEILKVEIYDIYGSTEFKEVAWECGHHQGYHINEDDVICEILNGDNPAAPGEVGDIVLTDLHNQAMPLIRYRIHDRGRLLSGNCRCGRTFSMMIPVAGRASEYILLPDGKTISPFRFTTAIENVKGLLQYQLVQQSATDILVKVILDAKNNNLPLAEIENTIKKITGGQMQIHIRKTDRIINEENGKFKVIKNILTNDC